MDHLGTTLSSGGGALVGVGLVRGDSSLMIGGAGMIAAGLALIVIVALWRATR